MSTAAMDDRKRFGLRGSLVVQMGVLLASTGLMFVQMGRQSLGPGHRVEHSGRARVYSGEVVSRQKGVSKPGRLLPVNDPERVKQILPEGSRQNILVKGGYCGEVEIAFGARQPRMLVYAFETEIDRTIESNDGRRIVEVRRFTERKMVKLVTDARPVSLDLGLPKLPILKTVTDIAPEEGTVELPPEAVAEAIVSGGAASLGAEPSRAFARADSLSGKQVRITYVDGIGVESVEPLHCNLTGSELKLLLRTPVLADCYLGPPSDARPNATWEMGSEQLLGILDPSLPATSRGKVSLRNVQRSTEARAQEGLTFKMVQDSTIDLHSTVGSYGRIATYVPEGELNVSPEGRLQSAELKGDYFVLGVSQDNFLFDEILQALPKLQVSYWSTTTAGSGIAERGK